MFRSQVHPDYFATILFHMGVLFNDALIAVENNGHGLLTVTRLGKDMAYPNMYLETIVDKISDKETIKLGFSYTSFAKLIAKNSKVNLIMLKNEIDLKKITKNIAFGNKIFIAMGAGSITNWVRNLN